MRLEFLSIFLSALNLSLSISLSDKYKYCVNNLNRGCLVTKSTLATPQSVAHQRLSMGLPRQEYWSGSLFFFSPGNNLNSLYTQNLHSVIQFSSVAQSCMTLCDPMNRSTPGLSVHHQLPEFTQTHVHRVSDAIQPSHPLSSPSPPAPNPSQHQSLPIVKTVDR